MVESLVDRIKRHEGLTLMPKPDAKGFWAIGYGHDITEQDASDYPNGCSLEDAENWLNADIQKATDGVNEYLTWTIDLDEIRKEVLIEMAFEIGVHGLLEFHETLAACEAKQYDVAAAQMLNSDWHTEAEARCEELANIMLTGETE